MVQLKPDDQALTDPTIASAAEPDTPVADTAPSAPTRRPRVGLPRAARGPLLILIEASAFATLALLAAMHTPVGSDEMLAWLMWIGMAVAAIAAVVFAYRTGGTERRQDSVTIPVPGGPSDTAAPDRDR